LHQFTASAPISPQATCPVQSTVTSLWALAALATGRVVGFRPKVRKNL
jgi:hypothetical protein